jgi:hypothetical protein
MYTHRGFPRVSVIESDITIYSELASRDVWKEMS